ncbi:MAG: YbaK/EbsC family protein [candidate division NC10 bacterium]|nr:YbaK/EbsC family protein [candidate division NC10 bacterium]MCH7896869.1 YbaK/EbsC family protein [candidate division NC10 bacterium]MCZ6550171.1 YbaK/EbsC family protein [candidate division NC10 bacterium]
MTESRSEGSSLNPQLSTLSQGGAERVALWMAERGIAGEIIRPGAPTPTVEAAAVALGVSLEEVVKSLLFLVDRHPYLVIVRGTARVNTKKLLKGVGGKKARIATREEVERITGFPVGGTPPFAHREALPVLIDRAVLSMEEVYAGGGSTDVMLRIRAADLLSASGGRVVDVA